MTNSNRNTVDLYTPQNIGWAQGIKLTAAQLAILDKAYDGYATSTVVRQIAVGKSGALVFLIERNDRRYEIAKIDHPYALRPEVEAYKNLVMGTSPEYRVDLRGGLFRNDDHTLGVIIYNFLSQKRDTADNSLLEYFHRHGGDATADVLEHIFEAYGPQWWDNAKEVTVWYGEEYDRLLPTHLTARIARNADQAEVSLQSGRIDWSQIQQLHIGKTVRLRSFEITECREGILRLQGLTPEPERSTNLRVKLEGLDPEQYQPGQTLPDVFAEITATRAELLTQDVHKALGRFSKDGSTYSVNHRTYNSPLRLVDPFLNEAPLAKSSIIHGDLNLRNIVVHENTGFAWLIDFAHTRQGGPTLFDLQRLEDHAIAELLAPLMAKRNNPNEIVMVLNALHTEPLNPHSPVREWQDAYKVLYKIRQLARPYLPRDGSWREYYRGLFLVFVGALKYERTPYQRALLLIGAATVQTLMDQPLNEGYRPKRENPMQKWKMGVVIGLLLLAGLVIFSRLSLPVLGGSASSLQISGADWNGPWFRQTTLARIQRRGYLICGISGTLHGFSKVTGDADETGFYKTAEGLDADLCRTLAIAIWGSDYNNDTHVRFLVTGTDPKQTETQERFRAVREGKIDVLFRNTTLTGIRDAQGVDFGPVYLYDHQKFMVGADSGIHHLEDLAGKRICVLKGTTSEQNLQAELQRRNIQFQIITAIPGRPSFTTNDEAVSAYVSNVCDAVTSDATQLISRRSDLRDRDNHRIIPEEINGISDEPFAPVVANGDSQWQDIVYYAVATLIFAEKQGINSNNVDALQNSDDVRIREFLGATDEEDCTEYLGEFLGLKPDFSYWIIKTIGNYGELYEKHLARLVPDRGPNQPLGIDSGWLFAPPLGGQRSSAEHCAL